MRIVIVQKIEVDGEDKVGIMREFDPVEEYAAAEWAARNSPGVDVDISEDDPRLREPLEFDPNADAFERFKQSVFSIDGSSL